MKSKDLPDGVAAVGSMAEVIDLVARRAELAKTATPSLAGQPYRPGSGSEGVSFEDHMCGSCDRYRISKDDILDCTLDHLQAAFAADDINDPTHPKAWVHDAEGRPTCTDWKTRTAAADEKQPTLCGGATSAEQELAAYQRAMAEGAP